jgi:hypothetical protein
LLQETGRERDLFPLLNIRQRTVKGAPNIFLAARIGERAAPIDGVAEAEEEFVDWSDLMTVLWLGSDLFRTTGQARSTHSGTSLTSERQSSYANSL